MDAAWLRVRRRGERYLCDEGGLRRAISILKDPHHQWPSIQLFVGSRTKEEALRALFPYNNVKRSRSEALVNLRADNGTSGTDSPIFFADSNPAHVTSPGAFAPSDHQSTLHPLKRRFDDEDQVFDFIHANLLSLFCDVICIFLDDFESVSDLLGRLATWPNLETSFGHQVEVRPAALVVLRGDESSCTYNLLEEEEVAQQLNDTSFFSSTKLLRLADSQASPLAQFLRLKNELGKTSDEMRRRRRETGWLFSAAHLTSFSEEAVKHVAGDCRSHFDFVAASRHLHTALTDHREHLSNYTRLVRDHWSTENWLWVLSSSILMDAYPPGMHG